VTLTGVPALAAPFRGLLPFGESELDALLFFGREHETEIAVANLLATRLTILYGPSGVGKSSLLHAGVARRIRELAGRRALGRGPDGAVVVFASWTDEPVSALADALAQEVTALVRRAVAPPSPDARLADVVEHWSTVLDGDVYLVLDQLEEYFVYHDESGEPGRLVDELPEVILRPRLRANVILSLRDDALSRLDVFKASIPNVFANYLRLDALDHAAATAAIVGPIRRWNEFVSEEQRVDIEPALVERVLTEAAVADEPGRVEPPYLQLVMERLWNEEHEQGSRLLRASTLEELGGAGAIVREHLDRALSVLGPGQQDAASRMFEHLVTPSGTKVAHRAADLARFSRLPEAEAGSTIAALRRERILRPVDESSETGPRYEIYHDVLAAAILGWCGRREVDAERAQTRRRHKRLVALAIAALVAVLVMAAITVFALSQRSDARSRARSARARALAASALTELELDPELSLVLARQAAALSPTPEVEDVLLQTLFKSRVREVSRLGAPAVAAAFTPGGRRAVAITDRGRVSVLDPSSGRVLRSSHVAGRRQLLDPTGRFALGYGVGGPAQLLSVADGKTRRLGTAPSRAAWFSPRGGLVLTSDGHSKLRLWDTATGRLRRTFAAGHVDTAAISPDETTVAAADAEHAVDVFDVSTGRRARTLPESSHPTKLVFSPSSRLLAVAGEDKTVGLQDARTGGLLATYTGHVGDITDIAFSPGGALVATTSTDGTARIWHVGGGLVTILNGHNLYVTSAAFSSDGERVVTTSTDGTARVWKADTGDSVAVLAGHGEPVESAAFSADGNSVVTAGLDGSARFWDAVASPTLEPIRRLRYPVPAARAVGGGIVIAPPHAPDIAVQWGGTRFATVVGHRVVVRVAPSRAVVATFTVAPHSTGIALAPDGRTVAVAGSDGDARLYALDGRLRRVLHGGRASLTRIAFSHDGRLLAAGSTDRTAKLWTLETGATKVLRGHTASVLSARFSPNDRLLVTASLDHDARIWDVATGDPIRVLRGHYAVVSDADWSSDGRWVVTAGPTTAGLWYARTGERFYFLQGHKGKLTSASFAGTSQTIVTSGVDRTVRTYECRICTGIVGLTKLADRRLAATGRRLKPAEQQSFAQ
jgi:WD40 repeat protein